MTYVWPFEPSQPPQETLEWLTSVVRCRATEQRAGMRAYPRQEWSYAYSMRQTDYGRAKDLAKQIGVDECLLPVWMERTAVGTVNAGTVTLPVDTSMSGTYREGGKALVWSSSADFEVVTVQLIGTGTITVTATTATHTGALVMPLQYARFGQELGASRYPADWEDLEARFVVIDTDDLSTRSGGLVYDTYRGDPFISNPVVSSSLTEQFSRDGGVLDIETGVVFHWPSVNWVRMASQMSWKTNSAAELWALRVWLHQMKGQLRRFWLSSWNPDIRITADIDGTSAEIEAMAYGTYFPSVADFVIATATEFFGMRVNGHSAGSAGHEVLSLAASLTVGVADIVKTSRLVLSRFASDRVSIQHGFAGEAHVTVPTVEVPA